MALKLGRTYQELVSGVPGLGDVEGVPEIYWWMAFDRYWPFGYEELLLSSVATLTHNAHTSDPRYRADFYDYWHARKPKATPREFENKLRFALGIPVLPPPEE